MVRRFEHLSTPASIPGGATGVPARPATGVRKRCENETQTACADASGRVPPTRGLSRAVSEEHAETVLRHRCVLVRMSQESRVTSHEIPHWLVRVRTRVAESCRNPPSRAELARQAGVDVAHLSRAFRAHFGTTIMEFARARRLADALRWLALTDEPVSAVARRCGYSDQGHLARECRRQTGLTPAAWRRAAVMRGMAQAS